MFNIKNCSETEVDMFYYCFEKLAPKEQLFIFVLNTLILKFFIK